MFFCDNMHKKYFQIRWIFAASDIQATGKEDSCLKDADKTSETQVFSCEYCQTFKNTYFEEDLVAAASVVNTPEMTFSKTIPSCKYTLREFFSYMTNSYFFHKATPAAKS